MNVFLRTAFNYDRDAASDESGLLCEDLSRTHQSFAEECDINTIVRRFNLTGELPGDIPAPTFADFMDVVDFTTAMNAIAKASEAFDALPAEVRSRFNNDPAPFVEFCSTPGNEDELRKLGLLVPVQADKPADVAPEALGTVST